MSKHRTDTTPTVARESRGYGQTVASFTVTYPETSRVSGSLTVRFHAIDRASVTDTDHEGIRCGAHSYRVHATYVRRGDGWTLEETRGLPPVYRADELWTRPAPTIDRKIRSAAHGAVAMVANLYPDATVSAEVTRLTHERDTARGTVESLRAQLVNAERALADADRALADATPA